MLALTKCCADACAWCRWSRVLLALTNAKGWLPV